MNSPPAAPTTGPLLAGAEWIEAIILGPLATGVAVLAIASIGLFMLSGRIDYRRGLSAIAGCFIVFGAANIANGLMKAAQVSSGPAVAAGPIAPPPAPPPRPADAYDPYAGASLIRN